MRSKIWFIVFSNKLEEHIQQASSPKASEQINKWRHTLEPVKQHIYIYIYIPIYKLRFVVLLSISCESFHVSMGFDQLCRSNETSNQSPLSSMASYSTNSLNRALTFNDEGKLVPEPTTMLPDIRSIRDLPGRKWSSPKEQNTFRTCNIFWAGRSR